MSGTFSLWGSQSPLMRDTPCRPAPVPGRETEVRPSMWVKASRFSFHCVMTRGGGELLYHSHFRHWQLLLC